MRLNRWKSAGILATFVLCLLARPTPAAAQSWSNGFARRRTITVDHTKVPNTDQTNFPILISGTYPYLATTSNGGNVTSANGYDIIFTSDAGGTTTLAFERESYNPNTGAATFWVKIPTLSHATDTVLYMFYSNSSVTTDQSNKTGVWDANFKGVWHLGQDPSGMAPQMQDSTTNANNGAAQGTWTGSQQVSGKIGGSLNFISANGNYLSTTNSFSNPGSETLQGWFKTSSTSGRKIIGFEDAQSGTGGASYDRQIWLGSNGKIYGGIYSCTYSGSLVSSSTYNDGGWHQVALTLDTSAQQAKLFVDGTQVGSTISCSGAANYSGYFRIGSYALNNWDSGVSGYFNGGIDEARISLAARSGDWIATEYNNQSNPATFYAVGSDASSAPNIASLSSSSGLIGTSITIAGTNFGSTQGSSTVKFNGTTATATNWSATSITATVPSGASPGDLPPNSAHIIIRHPNR